MNNELKVIRNEIEELDCLAQFARLRVFLVEIDQEKVLNEMKAYVGGDAGLEVIQKRRGFSNYRDLFIKKIHEVEIHSKQLKERLKDLQVTFEDI